MLPLLMEVIYNFLSFFIVFSWVPVPFFCHFMVSEDNVKGNFSASFKFLILAHRFWIRPFQLSPFVQFYRVSAHNRKFFPRREIFEYQIRYGSDRRIENPPLLGPGLFLSLLFMPAIPNRKRIVSMVKFRFYAVNQGVNLRTFPDFSSVQDEFTDDSYPFCSE